MLLQVVFDGLFGDVSNGKLQLFAMELILSVISKYVNYNLSLPPSLSLPFLTSSLSFRSSKLTAMSPLLLTALYKIIDNDNKVRYIINVSLLLLLLF